jgi:hypothetical protein
VGDAVPSEPGDAAGAGDQENSAPALEGAAAGSTGYDIRTSLPDSIDRHDISDEELTMLVDPRRDRLADQKWGYLGLAGGAAIPAIAALVNYFFVQQDINVIELITVVFFFAFAALAVQVHVTDKRLAVTPSALASKIRARTRQRVQGVHSAGE